MSLPPTHKRLTGEDRRRQIIDKATHLFAEHGFSANTRMLASAIGTTQPLLYRYFPSKDDLVAAVLQGLMERQTATDWQSMLVDRSVILRDRLVSFSLRYANEIYDREWIRIYMYAGLMDGEFNRRVISSVTEPLLRTIANEVRQELNIKNGNSSGKSRRELDLLWVFHGGLYYNAIRRHIYGFHVDDGMFKDTVETSVDSLIFGIKKLAIEK